MSIGNVSANNLNAPAKIWNPSPQQAAVVDFVRNQRGSAFVEAVAGAGKTTTLINALEATTGSVGFAAYNKKIADEIKGKVGNRFGNRVRIGTFHSFGLGAWRYVHKSVEIDERKKTDMVRETLGLTDKTSRDHALIDFVPRLISLAKQRALGLYGSLDDFSEWYKIVEHFDMAYELEDETLVPRGIELAIKGLKHSTEIAREIVDFDDMLYMPVISGIRMWQNDVVFVDEAQDTNPVRRALTRKMIGTRGRAIFVGDRHQAIYGFTGADNDAVDQIVRDFNCKVLPLTVTYRCPKAVVQEARKNVDHIVAHETAPEGSVRTISVEDVNGNKCNGCSKINAVPGACCGHNETPHVWSMNDAILCRKTKPLVDMAFSLIRQGIACHVEGRDIGAGLIALVDKFKSARTVQQLMDRMGSYGVKQCEKLKAKGKDAQAEALSDRIATVAVIGEKCATPAEIKVKILDMFQDDDQMARKTLTLSTVHKAKGREWPRVFILGANLWMPGPWARQAWEQEQERNIVYVSVTRAQNELVFINMPEGAK